MCKNGCTDSCDCNAITIPKGEKGDQGLQGISGVGVPIVNITYVNLSALMISSRLVVGAFYKITDRADLGIIVQATDLNKVSVEGKGLFLNADYQNVYGNNLGIWNASLVGISIGKVVIYGGIQYSSVNGVLGTNPSIDTVNWIAITPSQSTYMLESDFIKYNFTNDTILYREDKRNNEIYTDTTNFQWGNDLIANNIDYHGTLNIINSISRVFFVKNNSRAFININETNNLTVYKTEFGEFSRGVTFNLCTGTVQNCIFNLYDYIVITGVISYRYMSAIEGIASTFTATLDMSDSSVFLANVLTVPSGYFNHIGIFTLINNTGQTIGFIINLPAHNKVRFYINGTLNQSFSHSSIGTNPSSGALVANSATIINIIGRGGNGNDFIEYEKSGTLNRMYQVVKLV